MMQQILGRLMKLRQFIYTAILGLISSCALASSLDKFYIAADAGIFQANFNNQFLDQTDAIKQNIAQTATQYGYTGGIAFGFRRLLNPNYFIGGEFSANIAGNNASFQSGSSSTAFSDQIKINNYFNLTFVPGLMLSNSIATYLKLGLSYAFLEDRLSSPAGFSSAISSYRSNKNAVGFAAGLGVAKSISERVSIFTEANYNDYGTIDFSNFQNFMATYSHSTHIYSYDVVIGAAYTI